MVQFYKDSNLSVITPEPCVYLSKWHSSLQHFHLKTMFPERIQLTWRRLHEIYPLHKHFSDLLWGLPWRNDRFVMFKSPPLQLLKLDTIMHNLTKECSQTFLQQSSLLNDIAFLPPVWCLESLIISLLHISFISNFLGLVSNTTKCYVQPRWCSWLCNVD